MAACLEVAVFKQGDTVCREGTIEDCMYIVHSGVCEILNSQNGIIATATNNMTVGDTSILTEEDKARSSSVKACSPELVCFKLSKADY